MSATRKIEVFSAGCPACDDADNLRLRLDPASSCADVKAQAQAKIVDIEEKLRRLQRMKRALVKLTNECRGQGATTGCPILDSLDRNERRP